MYTNKLLVQELSGVNVYYTPVTTSLEKKSSLRTLHTNEKRETFESDLS